MRLVATITEADLLGCPAWAVMWLLAIAIFACCKVITWSIDRESLSAGATAAYLFGWPGLNPIPFVRRSRQVAIVTWKRWTWALAKIAFGIALVAIAVAARPTGQPWVIGWTGMVGLVFLLHFGIFDLLACLWKSAGYDVQPIMDAPHRSTSLIEFWSCRWNRAFRDVSNRLLLRPVRRRLGPRGAMWTVFLFSGVVHDVVVSVPARGGYGLPTMYFLLQAAGIVMQRTRLAGKWHIDTGVGGWVVTALWLIIPLPLLFHERFVTRVILPFLDAIRHLIS